MPSNPCSCGCGCQPTIHIGSVGTLNVCGGGQAPTTPPMPQPTLNTGATAPARSCIPVVAGAKHKLDRAQRLAQRLQRQPVPSALAAALLHRLRRFSAGHEAADDAERAVFAKLAKLQLGLAGCAVGAVDALPQAQRQRLFASALALPAGQPLDAAATAAAVGRELMQRIGLLTMGDPLAGDGERAGLIRVFEPQGESFFSQVRICRVNGLRVADHLPPLSPGEYLPGEYEHQCKVAPAQGVPAVVCEVQTGDCPGNTIGSACAVVPEVAAGDGVLLQGVNYFSTDAKVSLTDRASGRVREVPARVWGDLDTPVTEDVGGKPQLVNDCRVADRLVFRVPADMPAGVQQIQVLVPNISGLAALGATLVSNAEFIEVVPARSARYRIETERIRARQETSPWWAGSDEVGLTTIGWTVLDAQAHAADQHTETFPALRNVDFDSGTMRSIPARLVDPQHALYGVAVCVLGYEIDSDDAYEKGIRDSLEIFAALVSDQKDTVLSAISALGGVSVLKGFSPWQWVMLAIAAALTAAVDLIVALWAPADLIIEDAIGLTAQQFDRLTSPDTPAPAAYRFTSENGLEVNVNTTDEPDKRPFEYHETREYVSGDQDSRYEIRYRFSRVV